MANRFMFAEWGANARRRRTSNATWRMPYAWNRKAQREGVRYRVFTGSLCDVFDQHKDVTEWRAELFDVMVATPNLDWLVLTKRPYMILEDVPAEWLSAGRWPANVHMGVSVEDQRSADNRLPWLMNVPSPVRFVSAEPLLEEINLNGWHAEWLIVGGESGHDPDRVRPMSPLWVRKLQSWAYNNRGVAFYMKQMGAWIETETPGDNVRSTTAHGRRFRWRGGHGDGEAIPADLRIREYPDVLANAVIVT